MYSLQHLSSQKLIAVDQLGAYLQGADASEVFLYDGRSLEDFFKTADIAGILSANRRVLGMMPHPERLIDPAQSGTDGAKMFSSLVETLH